MTRRQPASSSGERRRRRGRTAAVVCGISLALVVATGTMTWHAIEEGHAGHTRDAAALPIHRAAPGGAPFTAAAPQAAVSRAAAPATLYLVDTQAAAERLITERDQANITHAMAGEPLLDTGVVVASAAEQVERLRAASAGLGGYPATPLQLVDLRRVGGEPTTGAGSGTAASVEEQNKAVVRRIWAELHDQGNVAVADELLTPDSVLHISGARDITGIEAIKRFLGKETIGFPDSHYTIEDLVAEGDRVVTRWTYLGTFSGDYYGTPPTGKQLTSVGISIHRLVDGKVAESWWVYDTLNWQKQLGLIPAP